jgi:FKBP-type peptidyl-prolyl cis-trans isomerase FklB
VEKFFMYRKVLRLAACIGLILFSRSLFAADQDVVQNSSTEQATMLASQNKLVGQAFLAKNMSQAGVVTLPDGLEYRILKPGDGPRPTVNDTVTVHYMGRLINGKEFDSSYKRGEPATFPVSGVIPGWVEALERMNKGALWELYIPSSLAYGERGAPPYIGPNETLIFRVELLDIKK